MIEPESVLRYHEAAVGRSISDLFVVLHGAESELHTFNDVGMRVWELIDSHRSVADIADTIASEFEVTIDVATADAVEFCETLLERNLVVVV